MQILTQIKPFLHDDFSKFYNQLIELKNNQTSFFLPTKPGIKKDILFLGGTHGDEKIGLSIWDQFSEEDKKSFDWLSVNIEAQKQNVRFLEKDVNRSAPGNIDSSIYEERRVAEVIREAKNYNFVIDLHESVANCQNFIIMTKFSFEDLLLALRFDIENIVIWPASEILPTGPIVQYLTPGIEIENGPKGSVEVSKSLVIKIKKFLTKYQEPVNQDSLTGKNIFIVTERLENCPQKLRDFEKTNIDDEEFYPLLVGEYGISCYKMFKLPIE